MKQPTVKKVSGFYRFFGGLFLMMGVGYGFQTLFAEPLPPFLGHVAERFQGIVAIFLIVGVGGLGLFMGFWDFIQRFGKWSNKIISDWMK